MFQYKGIQVNEMTIKFTLLNHHLVSHTFTVVGLIVLHCISYG